MKFESKKNGGHIYDRQLEIGASLERLLRAINVGINSSVCSFATDDAKGRRILER